MVEPITIVEVEQVGESGLVVIFSDGTMGCYSAVLLASMSEASNPPLRERDRLFTVN